MSSSPPVRSPDGDRPATDTIDVLSLVTTDQARFYRQQVAVLEELDVSITTLSLPGKYNDGENIVSKTALDYLRLFPPAIRHSFGSYDLLHANFGLTGPMALAQWRLPVVLSLWGTDVFGRYGWMGRLSSRLADEVIVMSDAMAEAVPADAHVIPHGVDLDVFAPADQREAQRLAGWDPDVKHVLFPYRPGREVKNYPLAERVVTAVDDRLDEPVEIRTVFGVPHDEMPLYMNAADALLLPSKWEGSPNSVKEAMACNLPVVTTDVGDVRERLAGVEPSSVCRSEREMVEELAAVLEQDRRSNGREAAAEVSVEQMGRRIIEVYEGVLSDAVRRPAGRRPEPARVEGQR